jgi:APA family basic amino acid/polyamine antiporter
MPENSNSLKRSIGLFGLILYGTGNILGAGIYGLIGKVTGAMGNGAWLAFIVSMVAAGLTGLSYASVGSRYPKAGGAVYASARAFQNSFLSYAVGFMVMMSGLLSMATATRIFSGYLHELIPNVSATILILGFVFFMTGLVFRGMKESLWFNVICTSIELGGLLFVIAVGMRFVGDVSFLDFTSPSNPEGHLSIGLILAGATLTFYSFIGFEDILNVSEEVKNPAKTVPRGLIIALLCSSLVYVAVSFVAVSVLDKATLASSAQPMVDIVSKAAPWMPSQMFSYIALFAVSNTVLLNFITTSRLILGMSRQGLLPAFLQKIHPERKSPQTAVLVIGVVLLGLAMIGEVTTLAKATAIMLLCSFMVVNASLVILKRKEQPKGTFEVPTFVPVAGFILCILLLSQAEKAAWFVALGVFALIGILFALIRPKLDQSAQEDGSV